MLKIYAKKFKDFFKNQYFILAMIMLIALFVRLLNIDKTCGLWFDEMLTYNYSSKSFPFGIIKTLLRYDYHMPLYYMFAHIWMKFFGTDDIVLRCSSVMWGVLTIPAFFFLGKIYRSKTLGYFLAVIACLSPVLIYFSQEFRFYSMLMFFATLSIIAFLKLIENFDKKYLVLFGISNLIILYIYTMGMLFVSVEFFLLLVHFYLYKKDSFKKLIKFSAAFFICTIPYLFLLCIYLPASSKTILDSFASSKVSFLSLFSIVNDWFSPFLTCQYGASEITNNFFGYNLVYFIVFSFLSISTLCFVIGFIYGIKKISKSLIYLLIISSVFLSVEIFLALTGNFILLTKYTLICLPIVLLISADGLLSIKQKSFKNTLISIIFILFVYNIVNYAKMPAFSVRPSGYKTVTNELNKLILTQKDYVIYPDGTMFLKKYLKNTNYIEFDISAVSYLDKSKKEAYKIFDKDFILTTTKHNAPEKFLPFFENPNLSKPLEKFINSEIKLIPVTGRLIFVENYSEKALKPYELSSFVKMTHSDNEVKKVYNDSIYILFQNKINNDLKIIFENNTSLKLVKIIWAKGPGIKNKKWKIFVYEKQRA